MAFVLPIKVLYSDIKKEILNFDEMIDDVDLFDVYIGENLEKNKKSLAFHITYKSMEKTLISADVDFVQDNLIKRMKEKYEAVIRDF